MIKNFATENAELLRKAADGDASARDELIIKNMGLVRSVVRRFEGRGYEMEDLFQIGCVGLLRAAERFDSSYEVQFSTYAVPMIIGEIRRYLRDNNAVRVSRSLRDIAYKALCVREKIINDRGSEPSVEEIAKLIDAPKEDVTMALDAIQEPISLFEPVYHDGGDAVYVMDQVSDKKNLDEAWIEKISLREAMEKLSEREKLIITLRFFRGRTQTEVANEVGISQAQVSRLEKSAIGSMRKYI
jgi:RNA polymerase sporulation-specific sigma factor